MDLDRLEALGRNVEGQPDSADSWLALAEALLDHRATDLARPMIARARACTLARADQWKLLAELALRLGDRATARLALRETVGLDETDVSAVAWFARVSLEDGEAEQVVPILQRCLARQEHPELRRWLQQAVAVTDPSLAHADASSQGPAPAREAPTSAPRQAPAPQPNERTTPAEGPPALPSDPSNPGRPPPQAPSAVRASAQPPRMQPKPAGPSTTTRRNRTIAVVGNAAAKANLSGDLAIFSLPDMLEHLAQRKSTGTLQILSKHQAANVHLENGRITDVDYPQRPSLLPILTEHGRSEGRSLTSKMRALPIEVITDEVLLTRALTESGIVDAGIVESAIQARIEDGILRVLQWKEAYAQFQPGPAHPAAHDGYDAQEILQSVLKKRSEAGKA